MTEIINSFPGYEFIQFGDDRKPHNMYRGEDVGFGGYVWAKPGMYRRTVCFDVSGMHPASIRALRAFGDFTQNFGDLVDARLAIKHKDFDTARSMLGGKLAPYLDDESQAKALAGALKIAVNSVYGLTSANFNNPFRDIRNKNNIVALRGALFMINLKNEVQERGFTVIHCKTDSIKVVEPDEEISNFIMNYGKQYGYNFEIEHIFEKICLVNDAVYIAKLAEDDPDNPGEWTATGTQFAVPYVFKTLFSGEPIEFEDMCQTFEVKSSLYLDFNETLPDVSSYEKELSKLEDNYKKGKISDTTFEPESLRLSGLIAEGHDYHFIGKVGRFTPVKPGTGGGILYRKQDDKYYAATGSSGYRWIESELLSNLPDACDAVDRSFYNKLVDDAVEKISQYGDFEWFVSDDPVPPATVDLPWTMPCGSIKHCTECPHFNNDPYHMDCNKGYDIAGIILKKFNDFTPYEDDEVPFL